MTSQASTLAPAHEHLDALGSEKGLKAFLAQFPAADPLRTVKVLGEVFEKAAVLNIPADKLRHALKHLDEHAQEFVNAVWDHLFDSKDLRTISDSPWLVLARYYRFVHAGYRFCLDALPDRDRLKDTERAEAVLLACRAMAALGRHKTVLKLRLRDPQPAYWEQMNSLAAWSSQFGGSDTVLELYPASGYQSSTEREHLIALVLEVAPVGNMLPNLIVALDLTLRRFAQTFHFSGQFRDETPFVAYTTKPQGPERWLNGLAPRPGQRFFGIGAAYDSLAELLNEARIVSQVPEWLAASRMEAAHYRRLLELLAVHWSTKPPRRRSQRERRDGEILVTHGIQRVRRMIGASEFAKSGRQLNYDDHHLNDLKVFGKFDSGSDDTQSLTGKDRLLSPMQVLQRLERSHEMPEQWAIADASENGLGIIASGHGGWTRVGMIVGYRLTDSLDCRIGFLSRLSSAANGKLSIGLRLFPGEVRGARVNFGALDASDAWATGEENSKNMHSAILLLTRGSPSVLLEPHVFSTTGECMLSFERRWRKVRLQRIVKRGFDYEEIELGMPLAA
ncbi:MAG: hypothetical protein ACKVQA_20125 [Burkholderiales bacterium]